MGQDRPARPGDGQQVLSFGESRRPGAASFGVLGDIHGDFPSVARILAAHPEIPFWLCVGDVADPGGRYEPFAAPVYTIKGNNENFDVIDGDALPRNLHLLANGVETSIDGLRVVGLGGTFAPTWYDTPSAALPHPRKGTAKATEQADKRRHFVREEVDRCLALTAVDVFMSHEAPRPYRIPGRGNDAGKSQINDILAGLKPRLHLFGHHHRFTEQVRQGVQSVGLDLVGESYLLVDRATLQHRRFETAGLPQLLP